MFSLLFLIPIFADSIYPYQFLLPILSVLCVIGLLKLSELLENDRQKNVFMLLMISLLLLFSIFTLYTRFGSDTNYLTDRTYSAGLFLANQPRGTIISNSQHKGYELAAVSNQYILPDRIDKKLAKPDVLAYIYDVLSEENIVMEWKDTPNTYTIPVMWYWYLREPYFIEIQPKNLSYRRKGFTSSSPYDSHSAYILDYFDVEYLVIEHELSGSKRLMLDMRDEWPKIYDNGIDGVWRKSD